MWKLGNLNTPVSHTRFVDPLFGNFAYIKKNHIFSLLKTVPYSRKYHFFRHCIKSTLIVWYFVSNKHYFIEQKRGKKKYVIFLVLGKLLKRWIPWWSACGSVSPSHSLTPPVNKEESTCRYICIQTYSYRTIIVNCSFVHQFCLGIQNKTEGPKMYVT